MAAAQPVPAFSYASGTICAKLSRGERTLLQDVSFSLSAGERLAIIGETGSGKTLLALSILGLLPANVRMQGGCIQMDGTALPTGKQLQTLRGDKLVYIPQNGAEFLLPVRTVRKQLYDSLKKLGLPRCQAGIFSCAIWPQTRRTGKTFYTQGSGGFRTVSFAGIISCARSCSRFSRCSA